MSPVRSYTNWNSRSTDNVEQREPYRKYFFICDMANTETWYFRKRIDIRKFYIAEWFSKKKITWLFLCPDIPNSNWKLQAI